MLKELHRPPSGLLSRKLSTVFVFFVLVVLDGAYHYGLRHLTLVGSIGIAVVEAALCTIILLVTTRMDLARVTLGYLALPYPFFFFGWLNASTALLVSAIFLYCLTVALRERGVPGQDSITGRDLTAFLLILVCVNLSGAGGYGYQNWDYAIQNGRLVDLVRYEWPVRYGKDRNLVYYIGYFIPPAILGKVTNVSTAVQSMYVWTVLGATLSLRWLSRLSGWRFSAALVSVFVLFGPMDILNVLALAGQPGAPIDSLGEALKNPEFLDFRTSHYLGFFLGNFLSNTFQLYSSPQHVLAGWSAMGLMTYLFMSNRTGTLVFVYALLCLWTPLVMLALLPFVIAAALVQLLSQQGGIITLVNGLGAGSLAAVFLVFYAAGSGSANPSFWIFGAFDGWEKGWALLLFHLFGWGIYAAAVTPFVMQSGSRDQVWFACLVLTMLLLPLRTFGAWSDLLCRGAAPLMFLMLMFFLRAVRHYWSEGRRTLAFALMCLAMPGVGSALLQNRGALGSYGETQPVASILSSSYYESYPNLGPDGTLFERVLRRSLPGQPSHQR